MEHHIRLIVLLLLTYSTSSYVIYLPGVLPFPRTMDKQRRELQIALRIASWRPEDKDNIWERSGFVEGDIVLPWDKNAITSKALLWPGGVVPFVIHFHTFYREEIPLIFQSMQEISRVSCIIFRPWIFGDMDYIVISGKRAGCFSQVGRIRGPQLVNIQKGSCLSNGAAIHELLHALGFYHQHSVPNRDDHIDIIWDNVDEEHFRDFRRLRTQESTDLRTPYDYDSIMHYSSYAFSKNGKPTILIKGTNETLVQHSKISEIDAIKLRRLYNCALPNLAEPLSETAEKVDAWDCGKQNMYS